MPWWGQVLTMLGAFVSCMGVVIRLIWRMDPKSHGAGCGCSDCRGRRGRWVRREQARARLARLKGKDHDFVKRVDRLRDEEEIARVQKDRYLGNPPSDKTKPWWVDTAHLIGGRVYALNGVEYRLQAMAVVKGGYVLSLKNNKTRQLFEMQVKFESATQKVWEPR